MADTKRLAEQVKKRKIVEDKNIKGVKELKVRTADYKKLFTRFYFNMYVQGKVDAIEEIKDRWNNVKPENFQAPVEMQLDEFEDMGFIKQLLEKYKTLGALNDKDREGFKLIRQQAFINAGETEEEMLETVGRVVQEGLRSGKSVSTIKSNITAKLMDRYKQYSLTVTRTTASDYYNQGRMNVFTSDAVDPVIEAYQYSAIMDNRTTEFCKAHDGQIIKKDDPGLSVITPPNHYNCRSILIPIFIDESKDKNSYYYNYVDTGTKWGTGVSVDARNPSKGFGG